MRAHDNSSITISATALLIGISLCYGCSEGGNQPYGGYGKGDYSIKFKDSVQHNADPPTGIEELEFFDTAGQKVQLSDYFGKKHVVLVFTRGFSGSICPFCATQTSRLIANYAEFQQRNAEVLLVYPGGSDHVEEFVEAAKGADQKQLDKVPFPILLDDDLEAVNFLEIAANLAYPSTYILDIEGNVRFAYVGNSLSDRPSIKALLEQLDLLEK